jgi:sterol 14-demethylase
MLVRALEQRPVVAQQLRSLRIQRRSDARGGAPPIAGGHIPYVGYAIHYGLEGPALLGALRAQLGDMFTLRLMGRHITFCLDKGMVEHLYEAPLEEVSFLEGLKFFPGFGTVITFDASGPENANVGLETLRRYLQPRVHGATEELDRELRGRLARLAHKPRLSLRADLGRAIAHMSACLLAGKDVANDDGFIEAVAEFDVATQRMTSALFAKRAMERATEARRRVEPFLRAAVAARRRADRSGAPRDFIEAMIDARDSQGNPLSDAVIASDVLGFMFATTANTPAAATMCLLRILDKPALLARVRAELDAVRRESGDVLDGTALKKLVLLSACMHEALRLYAPGIHLRMLTKDARVGGYALPRGTLVALSPYLLHRDPGVYSDPEEFDPDRFLDGPRLPRSKPPALHFVPFGRGLHACLGRTLAQAEVVLTLARVLSDYDLELLAPRRPLTLDWGTAGIAAPRHPVFARLTPRAARPPLGAEAMTL